MLKSQTQLVLAHGLFATINLLTTACTSECDRDRNPDYTELADGVTFDGLYESSPVSGPYLEFSSGSRWELFHNLGQVPRAIEAFLAFDSCPTSEPCDSQEGAGSGFTAASGNAVTFEKVEAQSVVVKNDTCADFFLRVVLSDPAPQ